MQYLHVVVSFFGENNYILVFFLCVSLNVVICECESDICFSHTHLTDHYQASYRELHIQVSRDTASYIIIMCHGTLKPTPKQSRTHTIVFASPISSSAGKYITIIPQPLKRVSFLCELGHNALPTNCVIIVFFIEFRALSYSSICNSDLADIQAREPSDLDTICLCLHLISFCIAPDVR